MPARRPPRRAPPHWRHDRRGTWSDLAQKRLPTDRVRVLALAAGVAQFALEGEVPESYVLEAVKTAMRAARAPDPTAH